MTIILRLLFASFVVGFLALQSNECSAQVLHLSGGNVRLTIRAPLTPGMDPQSDTDSSTRLTWLFPPRQQTKIVVTTIAPGQDYRLFAEATDVQGGFAQPEVQLISGMAPRDFVRNVTRFRGNFGRTTVTYRAEAPAAEGNSNSNGDDRHTVIYTWVAQ